MAIVRRDGAALVAVDVAFGNSQFFAVSAHAIRFALRLNRSVTLVVATGEAIEEGRVAGCDTLRTAAVSAVRIGSRRAAACACGLKL